MFAKFIPVSLLACAIVFTSAARAAEPSKDEAVQILKDFHAALKAKDYTKAITFLGTPPGVKEGDLQYAARQFIKNKEISAEGIAILAAKGRWVKLTEGAPTKIERYTKMWGVKAEECHFLVLGSAEAGFHWDGKVLKIYRCDDIGKLTADDAK